MMRTSLRYQRESGPPVHVLIADDSRDDRADIKAALLHGSTVRYRFTEADLGQEVIEKVAQMDSDVCLLLDFHLPDMDAFEVMRRLKPNPKAMLPYPVVIVTGSEQIEGGAQTVVRAGAMGFVGKDWLTPASVTLVVENAIERHALYREKERLLSALQGRELQLSVAQRAARLGLWDWDIEADSAHWCDVAWALFAPGAPHSKVTFQRWIEALHVDDRERVAARTRQALRNMEEFYRDEFRVVHPDGTTRWLESSGEVIPDASGKARRFIGCVRDITLMRDGAELREQLLISERVARSELQASSHLKDEFLATLAHELRNPLSNVISWSALLRKQSTGNDATMIKGLRVIESNARVQLKLISDLLDVNRIVRGKIELDLRAVDLNIFIEDSILGQQPEAALKDITLAFGTRLASESFVRADTARLHQIVGNLLSNALKFTPHGGSVSVDLSAVDGGYEITIRDTGEGIAADFLPFIFDRFRQGDAKSARRKEGLGLGLAIVEKLVVLHGGTVRVTSEGPGHGSSFTVRLPAGAPLQNIEDNVAPSALAHSLHDLHVIAVDDEPLILDYMQAVLVEQGIEIHACATAADALASLRTVLASSQRAVLATDIGMPGEGGYGLLRKIRQELNIDADTVPVLAVTAFARERDRTQALDAGFQGYLTKPFDGMQLIAAIRAVIAGKSAP